MNYQRPQKTKYKELWELNGVNYYHQKVYKCVAYKIWVCRCNLALSPSVLFQSQILARNLLVRKIIILLTHLIELKSIREAHTSTNQPNKKLPMTRYSYKNPCVTDPMRSPTHWKNRQKLCPCWKKYSEISPPLENYTELSSQQENIITVWKSPLNFLSCKKCNLKSPPIKTRGFPSLAFSSFILSPLVENPLTASLRQGCYK